MWRPRLSETSRLWQRLEERLSSPLGSLVPFGEHTINMLVLLQQNLFRDHSYTFLILSNCPAEETLSFVMHELRQTLALTKSQISWHDTRYVTQKNAVQPL